MFQEYEQLDEQANSVFVPSIKVIGVGGAGGNAVNRMISAGVKGAEFIAINTDAQDLARNLARTKLALGKLGAGGDPSAGREAAENRREDIREMLRGTDMLFITAGMGGGTGTGAAPVVAEIAKEMGILTVGIVSKPFGDEGSDRMEIAEEGIKALTQQVNSHIVSLNDLLMDTLDKEITFNDALAASDDILKCAVAGIVETISTPGDINVDFADMRTAMGYNGRALMGIGVASGTDRAKTATANAITSPLLEEANLSNAKALVVNVAVSRGSYKLRERREIMETIEDMTGLGTRKGKVFQGLVFDESIGDEMRVTVIATGIDAQSTPELVVVDTQEEQRATGTYDAKPPFGLRTPTLGGIPSIVSRRGAPLGNSVEVPACLRRQAD